MKNIICERSFLSMNRPGFCVCRGRGGYFYVFPISKLLNVISLSMGVDTVFCVCARAVACGHPVISLL